MQQYIFFFNKKEGQTERWRLMEIFFAQLIILTDGVQMQAAVWKGGKNSLA